MPVEIERSAVSFTDEAQAALHRSLVQLERRIRAKAADNAIKSHGTPAEVTGSDIEKAYRDLIESNPRDVFDESTQGSRGNWRRSTRLDVLASLYTWLGLFVAVCGGAFPFIRAQLANPTIRASALFVASGLLLAILGVVMRAYLRYLEVNRMDDRLRHYYSRAVFYRKEPD